MQCYNVVTNPYQDFYSADVSVNPLGVSAQYKIRLMGAVLSRCKSVAEKLNIPIVFLFIPHALSVCENYGYGRVDKDKYPDYHRENLTKPLEDWARASKANFINLFSTFREHQDTRSYSSR